MVRVRVGVGLGLGLGSGLRRHALRHDALSTLVSNNFVHVRRIRIRRNGAGPGQLLQTVDLSERTVCSHCATVNMSLQLRLM